MILLVLFALLAGAGTALSPCVLPVLPAVLSAGVTGGRRRPLGVVWGLAISFTFATVALVYVIALLGLPNDLARTLAIVVLLGFGLLLLDPAARRPGGGLDLPGRARALLGRARGRVRLRAPRRRQPRLRLRALRGPDPGRRDHRLGGPGLHPRQPGGRARLLARLGRRPLRADPRRAAGHRPPRRLSGPDPDGDGRGDGGGRGADGRRPRRQVRERDRPTTCPRRWSTRRAGSSRAPPSTRRLAELRGAARSAQRGRRSQEAAAGARLPVYFRAPEFAGTQRWFNTPGGGPLSLAGLRGQVVLVDFWTYTCINCIRTLPYLEAWYRKYQRDGFTVVGVHTPEFPFEKEASNVERAIGDDGLTYPVAQDNDYATWTAYGNQYWPAKYLIDATREGCGSCTSGRAPTRRPSGRSAACSPRPGRRAWAAGRRPAPRPRTPRSPPPSPTWGRAGPTASRTARSCPAAGASARSPRPSCRPTIWPTAAAGAISGDVRDRGRTTPASR